MRKSNLKIVADEDLPFLQRYFEGAGELIVKPGRSLVRADLLKADLLLVRSVTRVDESLLRGTPVKFVGTVTTGFDHLDTAWLDSAGILWRSAHGYNAIPVAEYVIASIAALQMQNRLAKEALRIGVVGVGQIGSLVAKWCTFLGYTLLLSDPPRKELDPLFTSCDLSALNNLDLITLHTPLTKEGKYPTQHLINASFLNLSKNKSVLLNTSRGAVVDFAALQQEEDRWTYGFDVWEGEPKIDLKRLRGAALATPHLAGYSLQCRYRGIDMIYEACRELGFVAEASKSPLSQPRQHLSFAGQELSWQEVVLSIFNPLTVTAVMKETLLKESEKCATLFDELRQHYIGHAIARHEFGATTVSELTLKEKDRNILTKLGITIEE